MLLTKLHLETKKQKAKKQLSLIDKSLLKLGPKVQTIPVPVKKD